MDRKGHLPVESLELQLGPAEIDQQPNVEPGSFEVVDHLSLVLRSQRLHSLDFDQHLAVDDQVGVENTNVFTTEDDLEPFLFNSLEAGLPQRKHQSLLIHAFEEEAERAISIHGLRTLDAFQLAAALTWCRGRPLQARMASLDDRLTMTAKREGFWLVL